MSSRLAGIAVFVTIALVSAIFFLLTWKGLLGFLIGVLLVEYSFRVNNGYWRADGPPSDYD